VVDRPLDIDAGERIVVDEFELIGVVDRPEAGISRGEIEAIVEERRAASSEGFTVGRLQELADEITRYYRERGLILAQAFIPVQTVENGRVRLEVLEGQLGRVVAEGNEMYSEKVLQRPFGDLLGEPVAGGSAESALLQLTEYPGVTLFGVFQPGQRVGEADMVIKVQEEDRLELDVRADNHGIRETGQTRLRVDGRLNNPTGAGDRLTLTAQATEAPANSFFYAGEYERPIIAPGWLLRLGVNRNAFRVGGDFDDQDIGSETYTLYSELSRSIIKSRQRNLSARAEFARKHSKTKVRGVDNTREDLAVLLLGVEYDSVDARLAGLNAALLEYSRGFDDILGAMGAQPAVVPPSRQGRDRQFASGQFDKLFFSYSRLQSLTPLSEKLKHHSLLFRTEAQWSDDLLVPLEQYSIGGPNSVRAYQPTEFLSDRALYASLEWIINAPGFADKPAQIFGNRTWGEIIQVSLFYDWAIGRLNSPLEDGITPENFSGAGIGISFSNPNSFSARLSVAQAIGRPRPENAREPQYWFDLTLYF
ncbi:MAG: ShlB/FhaC/HecB family hemolysin secretion/activation protein, partial [Gammaproteobacteria bacterium]|nr:ShlB/FhaC/HecB family hemolysin secretion/activation protein [Gammaproteobacteria bacterium]